MVQNNKLFLVVDANVVGCTHHDPFDSNTFKAVEILGRILRVCHRVVLDIKEQNEDSILDEYARQARSDLAKKWLIAIQAKESGKIAFRHRATVHFSGLSDPDDEKYLQVAMNSPHKVIISEDSDLMKIADHDEIKSQGIRIWGFEEALAKL